MNASFSIHQWNVDFHAYSTQEETHHNSHIGVSDDSGPPDAANVRESAEEGILLASLALSDLYQEKAVLQQCFFGSDETKRGARVALADYAARILGRLLPLSFTGGASGDCGGSVQIKTMGQAKHSNSASNIKPSRRSRMRKIPSKREVEIPYVLERTDCFIVYESKGGKCDGDAFTASQAGSDISGLALKFYLHIDYSHSLESQLDIGKVIASVLRPMLEQLQSSLTSAECFQHIAVVVLQRQLRGMLQAPRHRNASSTSDNESAVVDVPGGVHAGNETNKYLNAVAFVADGSILPRKSGRSNEPMTSPPAISFKSPESDMLTRVVEVEVGYWRRYLNEDGSVNDEAMDCEESNNNDRTTNANSKVKLRGMIIPLGVTLIVGGGYHGKSTLLTALSMGIYDKTPHDGRERCVTHPDALSIRAEDGRYVNNVNVSAFISNLPTGGDTMRFGTRDASGSTSQAANVVEGLECGGTAFLVDEDVSAANFMARDGRMRAMIMDEPITPLLYRVNGLYLSKEHNVSTVVVVGGVGEWLDVADAVVLMKDYVAYDGLDKARSVSYQFSYNHVQYGGRGVVHRLPWEVKEDKSPNEEASDDDKEKATLSPLRRKPDADCIMNKFRNVAVHLLDSGSSRLWFYPDDDGSNNISSGNGYDEDDGIVDMSKCSQLLGNASEQLYGCGVCILWLLRESKKSPDDDIHDLLQRLESALDSGGMYGLVASLNSSQDGVKDNASLSNMFSSNAAHDLWEDCGFAYRPRVHEVAMTLTRIRGLKFDVLPEKPKAADDGSEEDDQKKKMAALAEMWSNRRKK